MQAGRFLNLVKNATNLQPDEVKDVQDLARRFPYSQLLHLLVARSLRDQKSPEEQQALHRAAVYSTDRGVLKSIMTRPVVARRESAGIVESASTSPPPVMPADDATVPSERKKKEPRKAAEVPTQPAPKTEPIQASTPITLEGDALRDDLKVELNRLHHLMSAFDATYEQLKKGEVPTHEKPARKAGAKAGSSKSNLAGDDTPEAPIIEEIKSSKRKPKLVSPKVAQQGEIIDNFIKVAPTLPRTKPAEPTTDLSEESVNYGDNIVSETLVEILLKQGKKAKAIEMLKKLIWKFPQKKAYFAAQIEALKG